MKKCDVNADYQPVKFDEYFLINFSKFQKVSE